MRAMAGDDSRANSAKARQARGELLEDSGPSYGGDGIGIEHVLLAKAPTAFPPGHRSSLHAPGRARGARGKKCTQNHRPHRPRAA